jgi:hypothetical protein
MDTTLDRFQESPPQEWLSDGIKVKGFFRIKIEAPDGNGFTGDSGWVPNTVTNEGKRNYLARLLGALASSSQIGYMALGTGGAPAAGDTTQGGEVASRTTVTAATNGSTSVQFTATFTSAQSFLAGTSNLSNVGLWATNTGGTLFAGNTYTSSSCATNQNVNATYTVTFT